MLLESGNSTSVTISMATYGASMPVTVVYMTMRTPAPVML